MAMASLYRRSLPSPPAIDFSSSEGKKIFNEALQKGTMEGFFRLISYFQTQSEPAYCGLASLSVVLNALSIDPGRKWKGPWRWFDESMLDCCEPLEVVKEKGISFGKVVCLAHCSGAKVEAFRTNQTTIDDFRKLVMKCSTSENCHMISTYHRGVFKQTGSGHFSPIGGYNAERDMALILDVARFKYPPHWVPLKLLWEAMDSIDDSTGKRRGFMLISRPHREPGLLYTLSCKDESWISIAKYLKEDVPRLVSSQQVDSVEKILSVVFKSLPSNFNTFIRWVAELRIAEDTKQNLSAEEKSRLNLKQVVLKEVHETELFKHISKFLSTVGYEDSLTYAAAKACCQGAEILSGCSSKEFCCRETCVTCVKGPGQAEGTVVTGVVQQVVQQLLDGENFHFGNPFLDWGTSVCSGKAHPDEIVSEEESLRASKRRYYADLEKYHNDIIDYLQMLKEKWESCKDPEKDSVKKMWRRSREGNNARVNGSCQDLTAASESSSWNEDDKPCNSDRAGEVRRRPKSSAVEKEKSQSPLIAQENVVNLGLKARNKDKLPKHSIQQTDGAKYMSYLKISKKQYQIVTSMKQSGKSIQSKALNKILGNINNLDVQPYGVFVEEEQKKLNAHWLQLVKDLPASYVIWRKLQFQKRDVINSLERELKDKLNPWMEVCSEKPLQKHNVQLALKNYDGDSLDPNQSGDLAPDVEDSGSLDQVSAKNQSLSKESSSDSDQITDSGRCLQVGEHPSQVSSPDCDNSINMEDTEANDYSSSINGQSLPQAPFPSEPHASDLGDANPSDERLPSTSSSHGDELQYCSGGDVWQPVGGTRQSYVGRQAYTPSGGLSIIHHPEGGEEEKNYFIEPDMPEEVDRRKILQPGGNTSFGSFPNNDQNELLQSLFKGQGGVASHSLLKVPLNEEHKQIMPIGFQQEGSNNLMEGNQFSGQFQHQMSAPQPLPQDQPRQVDIYGQGSLPDNIYCDGRGFLMPRPDWNASVAQLGVTTQPPLNTGPLLNQNWQFKSMWANTNGVSQSSHTGSERDMNLLRVATNPEQMIHRGSSPDQSLFSVFSQCSQLRRSRSALEPESSSAQVNYEMLMGGGTTQAGSNLAQPTNPLDYLSGSNNPAATSLMPDDVVWMNQSRENSGLHDPLGKLYPRSWNP